MTFFKTFVNHIFSWKLDCLLNNDNTFVNIIVMILLLIIIKIFLGIACIDNQSRNCQAITTGSESNQHRNRVDPLCYVQLYYIGVLPRE
jgi:hypothetical protein